MKQQKIPLGTGVVVKWVDSHALTGWEPLNAEQIGMVGKIQSLGYVVASRPDALAISTSISSRGHAMDILNVPWGCVVELEELPEQYDR